MKKPITKFENEPQSAGVKDQLKTIIENSKNDSNYVVDENFIEELRNRE
jgi:hypothetical protein